MAEAGREAFENFPEWVHLAFYVIATAALLCFLFGIWRHGQRYRRARRGIDRFDIKGLPARSWRALAKLAPGRSRIYHRDRYAGLAHDLMLWGFLVLFLGTIIMTLEEDVAELFFGIHFLKGDVYLVYSLFLDLFGLAFLIGLGMMLSRRWRGDAPRLEYDPSAEGGGEDVLGRFLLDDKLFLFLLVFAGLSGFVAEGFRIHRDGTDLSQEWSPLGVGLAGLWTTFGLSKGASEDLYLGLWWLHALGALIFVAYLPYSKAFHALAGLGSIVFADERSGRVLSPSPEGGSPGLTRLEDYTWVQLMHLDACVRCGRCHESCPAQASGLPLSPRGLITGLQRYTTVASGQNGGPLSEDMVPPEAIWSCTTCFACMEACPLDIEHLPFIVELRRQLVDQGQLDGGLQAALENLGRYGNSFRKPSRRRKKWAKGLETQLKDARKEAVQYLWLLGDYAAYDPRCQDPTRNLASILARLGLDVGTLGEAERNSGNDIRRCGEEGLFELLKEQNLKAMQEAQFEHLLTSDPHTYHVLKNEYPTNGGTVLHISELFADLIRSGELAFSKPVTRKVTFHDPCYLGRYNGVYEAPRQVLKALGMELVEMERSGPDSFCCGAGGGRIWMEDLEGEEHRPAEMRVQEAAKLPGVEAMVVTCPKDYVMFNDAVKAVGLEHDLQILDLIDLVEEAI